MSLEFQLFFKSYLMLRCQKASSNRFRRPHRRCRTCGRTRWCTRETGRACTSPRSRTYGYPSGEVRSSCFCTVEVHNFYKRIYKEMAWKLWGAPVSSLCLWIIPCDVWRIGDPTDDHQARKGRSHLGEDLSSNFLSLKYFGK